MQFRWARLSAAAFLAAAALAVPTATAHAALYQIATNAAGAYVFNDVTLLSSAVATLGNGTVIDIVCQTRGGGVENTTLWDGIDSPVVGWVPDLYTTTPNTDAPSPGLPPCA